MGSRQGAQSIVVWANDSALMLLDGIEDTARGKELAEARIRSLHPLPEGKNHYSTDFEKRLRKIFEKQSAEWSPPWLNLEFWQQEIDNVLIQGIFGRSTRSPARWTVSIPSGQAYLHPGCSTEWRRSREPASRSGFKMSSGLPR